MVADNPAFLLASPRYTPRAMSMRSLMIYGSIVLCWLAVLAGAWIFTGIWAWSAGLLYVTYDTSLLVYVARNTRSVARSMNMEYVVNSELQRPSLGVLIAARNEAAALPATLAALLVQSDPPDIILIVDDGSEDDTRQMLQLRYGFGLPTSATQLGCSAKYPSLRLLSRPHGGKARALNAGLDALHTDVVVTVDADTLLHIDAVAAMRGAFARESTLVAAGGVLTPVCNGGLEGRLFQWFQGYEYVRAFISRIAWMKADSLLLVSGALAGFRRDAVMRVGGFDADCLVEDYELIHRLHRYAREHNIDWRVRVLGHVRGVTDAPATLMGFLRQRRRWFAGFLQTQYWNRDMTGNSRYGTLGRLMLPIKAIDTMQPIYGLTAFVLLIRFLWSGQFTILLPVLLVIATKIVVDLWFHLWSVRLYSRWIGERTSNASLGLAALAALAEPFSFQLIRHVGAAWGWISFLSRRHRWETAAATTG